MNEIYTVEELALLRDKNETEVEVIQRINSGDTVMFGDVKINSSYIHVCVKVDDPCLYNKYLSSLSIHTPMSVKFYDLIGEKTELMAKKIVESHNFEAVF